MTTLRKIWQGLAGLGIIFNTRPSASYGQFLTDTVQYHH